MKKFVNFLSIVGALLVSMLLFSCSEPAVDEISLDVEKTKWEQSMYNAMYIAECKTLSLEDYKYLGDVTTEEDKQTLLEEIFGLDEYMVVANYEANIFDIITYGQSIEASTKDKNLYAPRKNNVASAIENRNIGIVELSWDYLGEKFKSKAIVATDGDKEFIYDNILSYAPVDDQYKYDKRVECCTTRSTGSDSYMLEFNLSDHGPYTLSLEYAWWFVIYQWTYFNSNGILTSRPNECRCSAAPGWDCEAAIGFVSGEINRTTYSEFMWGYAYGENMDVSVTGGYGVRISAPSGATTASATVSHNSAVFF